MKDEFKKVDIMKYNELLIGSNNKKKLNELKSLIDGLNLSHIEIKSPKDYNLDSLEIEENGSDFFENSLIISMIVGWSSIFGIATFFSAKL